MCCYCMSLPPALAVHVVLSVLQCSICRGLRGLTPLWCLSTPPPHVFIDPPHFHSKIVKHTLLTPSGFTTNQVPYVLLLFLGCFCFPRCSCIPAAPGNSLVPAFLAALCSTVSPVPPKPAVAVSLRHPCPNHWQESGAAPVASNRVSYHTCQERIKSSFGSYLLSNDLLSDVGFICPSFRRSTCPALISLALLALLNFPCQL